MTLAQRGDIDGIDGRRHQPGIPAFPQNVRRASCDPSMLLANHPYKIRGCAIYGGPTFVEPQQWQSRLSTIFTARIIRTERTFNIEMVV